MTGITTCLMSVNSDIVGKVCRLGCALVMTSKVCALCSDLSGSLEGFDFFGIEQMTSTTANGGIHVVLLVMTLPGMTRKYCKEAQLLLLLDPIKGSLGLTSCPTTDESNRLPIASQS